MEGGDLRRPANPRAKPRPTNVEWGLCGLFCAFGVRHNQQARDKPVDAGTILLSYKLFAR